MGGGRGGRRRGVGKVRIGGREQLGNPSALHSIPRRGNTTPVPSKLPLPLPILLTCTTAQRHQQMIRNEFMIIAAAVHRSVASPTSLEPRHRRRLRPTRQHRPISQRRCLLLNPRSSHQLLVSSWDRENETDCFVLCERLESKFQSSSVHLVDSVTPVYDSRSAREERREGWRTYKLRDQRVQRRSSYGSCQ